MHVVNCVTSLFSSVQFSRWVMSGCLRPHGLQQACSTIVSKVTIKLWKASLSNRKRRYFLYPCEDFPHIKCIQNVSHKLVVVRLLSCVWLFATPWTAPCQSTLSFTISWSLLKLMSIEWVMLPNHLILCCPLLLLPSISSSIRVFPNESALQIRWPKYWSFSFSISPSNEYSTLISFRIDWFDLLVIQGTLKGLLQHHNSKASMWRKF